MNTTERIEQLKDQVLPFRPFEAMEEAENLVNANPRDAESHFFLASIYKLLNRHHEAALTFEKTYELENSAHPALFNAGICFNELGQPDQALKFFDRAAEAAGTNSILPSLLGALSLHRAGDPEEAIHRYQKVMDFAPTNASLLYGLMAAERDRGGDAAAEQYVKQIQKGFSRYPESKIDLVTFHQNYDYAGWKAWADKDNFITSTRSWASKAKRSLPNFLPKSYIIPQDAHLLKDDSKLKKNPIWIVKSTTLSASIGTHLISDLSLLKADPNWIVQEYIVNPYLIKGRKFAMRTYLLVSSYDPVRAYLFRGGTAKIALRKYTTDPESFHLTSVHTEHTRPDRHRKDLKDALASDIGKKGWWTIDQLFIYLEKEGLQPTEIWNQACVIARTLIEAMVVTNFFDRHAPKNIRHGYGPKFIALDLILDDNEKLWLSEIERGPTYNRIFNSDGTEKMTFDGLANMAVCQFGTETDSETRISIAKKHEELHRDRFTLIYG